MSNPNFLRRVKVEGAKLTPDLSGPRGTAIRRLGTIQLAEVR